MWSSRRSIVPRRSVAASISIGPVEVIAERVEPVGPELAVGREPVVELGEGAWIEAVKPPRAVDADGDEPRLAQRLQVLADIGLRQIERLDQRAGRLLAPPEQGKNVATNGIGKSGKDFH